MWRQFFWGGFLRRPKMHFFGGPKWYFLKVKFQICISAFVLLCKRKHHANFHKKILIFGSPGIFWKWKLWRACAGARAKILESDFKNHTWPLVTWPVLSDPKYFHTPPYCTVQYIELLYLHSTVIFFIKNEVGGLENFKLQILVYI